MRKYPNPNSKENYAFSRYPWIWLKLFPTQLDHSSQGHNSDHNYKLLALARDYSNIYQEIGYYTFIMSSGPLQNI